MRPRFWTTVAMAALAASTAHAGLGDDVTAFTYQGALTENGAPAPGPVNLDFSLWDSETGGTQVGTTDSRLGEPLSDGLFTVTLEFEPLVFDGEPRWLEIVVNGTTLSPRQPLTPAPMAHSLPGFRTMREYSVDQGLIMGSARVIGGAYVNSVDANGGVVCGGGKIDDPEGPPEPNIVTGSYGAIVGGWGNRASYSGFVGGGRANQANSHVTTISGGQNNIADGFGATIPGGANNEAMGSFSFAAGSHARALHDGAFVWSDWSEPAGLFESTGTDQFLVQATGGFGLGTESPATPFALRAPTGTHDVGITQNQVGGASTMELTTADSVGNQATRILLRGDTSDDIEFYSGDSGFEARHMTIRGDTGRVAIGTNNPSARLTVRGNDLPDDGPVLRLDSALGNNAVESGRIRLCEGTLSYRGGYVHYDGSSNELHIGVHNTGDSDLLNDVAAISIRRSDGHVGMGTAATGNALQMASGASCTASGIWTNASSRRLKEGFQEVDGGDILRRLAALPVMRWSYRTENDGTTHIGPTAEDFHAAFAVGRDDAHIGTLDADGVALAAIQGLNQLIREKDGEIQELRGQVGLMADRLAALEARVGQVVSPSEGGAR